MMFPKKIVMPVMERKQHHHHQRERERERKRSNKFFESFRVSEFLFLTKMINVSSFPSETKVEVEWTNIAVTPSSRSDWISIALSGSTDSEWITYSYNKRGSGSGTIAIDVSDTNAKKEYVARYVAESGKVLAESKPFKFPIKNVSKSNGSLIPMKRLAGNKLEVAYKNFKSSTSDWIALCTHGSQSSDYICYTYIKDASLSKITIDCSGSVDDAKMYVLRYFNSLNKPICESEPFLWSSLSQQNITENNMSRSTKSTLHVSGVKGSKKLTIQWILSSQTSTTSDWISLSVVGSQSTDYVTYTYIKTGSSSNGTTVLDCAGYVDDDSKMFVARYVDSSSKLVVESKPFSWSTLIGTVSLPVTKNSTSSKKRSPGERLKDAHELLMQGLITQTDYDKLKSEVLGVKIETTSAVPLAHALQKIDIEEDDEIYDDSGAPLVLSSKIADDDEYDEMDPNGGDDSSEPELFSFWVIGADHTRGYGNPNGEYKWVVGDRYLAHPGWNDRKPHVDYVIERSSSGGWNMVCKKIVRFHNPNESVVSNEWSVVGSGGPVPSFGRTYEEAQQNQKSSSTTSFRNFTSTARNTTRRVVTTGSAVRRVPRTTKTSTTTKTYTYSSSRSSSSSSRSSSSSSSKKDMVIYKSSSRWAEVKSNGYIYVGSSRKGEVKDSGTVYVSSSRRGEINSSGYIYYSSSRKGEIRSNGYIYIGSSRVGEINSSGYIYKGSSRWGEVKNYSGSQRDRHAVTAVLMFFGGWL